MPPLHKILKNVPMQNPGLLYNLKRKRWVDMENQELKIESMLLQHGVPIAKGTLHRIRGDASARSFYRCLAGGVSMVVMTYPDHMDDNISEMVMLERFFRPASVFPKVLYDAREDYCLVFEDAGAEDVFERSKNISQDALPRLYKDIINQLIVMYSHAKAKGLWRYFKKRFTHEKLFWELNFMLACMRERLSWKKMTFLRRLFYELVHDIQLTPQVFCHRDFHSRNIMVSNERCLFVDFQDARFGPLFYDIASLLIDPYNEETAAPLRDMLYEYYLEQAVPALKVEITKSQAFTAFSNMCLQRLYKALGTFLSMNAKGRPEYLQYVPATLRNIERFSLTAPALEAYGIVKEGLNQ